MSIVYFFLFMLLVLVLGGLIFVAALCGFVAGLVGLIVRREHIWRFAGLLLISSFVLVVIGYQATHFVRAPSTAQYYDASDPEVRPFIDAINAVDRQELGFTPIPPHAKVSIESAMGFNETYNVMMRVYGPTVRKIAFGREGDTYIWLGEEESHTRPQMAEVESDLQREEIAISYETVPLWDQALNTVTVRYSGPNLQLFNNIHLTLQDVRPILQEWEQEKIIVTPEVP